MQTKHKISLFIIITLILLTTSVIFLYLQYEYIDTSSWKQLEITDRAERKSSNHYKVTLNYPPEWIGRDIEYLSQNTDIFFKTGTENYEIKLFIGTWVEPNGCDSYRQDSEYYDVMSCNSFTKEETTFIEGEYYDKKDEQKFVYTKNIYFSDRAFEFRALAAEYENLAFPKKVAKFFKAEKITVDQIPKGQEKQVVNDAIAKGQLTPIDVDPFFLSAIEVDAHLDNGKKILSLNTSGEYIPILDNKNSEIEYRIPYYLQTSPLIYISTFQGIEKSPSHYVIDFQGEESNLGYIDILPNNFAIPYNNGQQVIYTNPGTDDVLKIINLSGELVDSISSDQLPNREISSSRIVGLSGDGKYLYVTRIGWEGYEYGALWKINMDTKGVEAITKADSIPLGMLNVNPQKDLAVGIQPTEVACDDCFGSVEAGVPANLYLFDLVSNTFHKIYTSSDYLIDLALLSPDATKIFFIEDVSDTEHILNSINLDGSNKKEIGRDVKIAAMSSNADKLVLIPYSYDLSSSRYQILNVETGDIQNFQLDDYGDANIRFITCSYPLGFNCLYP